MRKYGTPVVLNAYTLQFKAFSVRLETMDSKLNLL